MLQNLKCEDLPLLVGRFRLYTLLREYFQDNYLYARLTDALIDTVAQAAVGSQEAAAGFQMLQAAWRYPEKEAEYEYNALFVGPRRLLAPPYESSYRNPEQTLMQQETMAVRECYTSLGLVCEMQNSMPDDHLATELEFVCYLHAEAGRLLEQGRPEQARCYLDAYREFFDAHLRQWIPSHCQDVLRHAKTSLCRGMALIMLGFFRMEEERLQLS